jgi:iron complex transport system substrate-binding protein
VTRARALVCLCAFLCACSEPASDTGQDGSSARIVTLAPNLAELVFAVGAGDQLVGVSAWSDYPRAVLELPEVGDAFVVDQEQLAFLNPDLLLVWESGTPLHTVEELRKRGYRVESVRTRGLDDVAAALRRVGELTGRQEQADAAAEEFTAGLQSLREQYVDQPPIDVFYQVSARPLYTVNREHYVSGLIDICGGRNIFDDLDDLAPAISAEAVIDRDPEVMLASTDAGDDAFALWDRWPSLAAIKHGNQFLLPADEIGRATPRLLIAGNAICLALSQARANRSQ